MPSGSLSETRLMDEYGRMGATGPWPATNPYSDRCDRPNCELAGRHSPTTYLDLGQQRGN